MNALRIWFVSRLLREKVLVLALVLLGALIWLSAASDRLREHLRGFRSAEATLATQQLWLNNQPAIEEAAAAAVRNLDPARTYDATFLVAEIMGIASRSGLAVNTEPPRTQRSSQFAVHTVQVTARRADLGNLLRFYQEVASKAPYLGLEYVSLQGDRTTPGMINATLQVVSVELVREGAR